MKVASGKAWRYASVSTTLSQLRLSQTIRDGSSGRWQMAMASRSATFCAATSVAAALMASSRLVSFSGSVMVRKVGT